MKNAQQPEKKPKEAVLTLVVAFDPAYLEDMKEAVETARGYGTIVKAEVVIPAETVIDIS